MLDQLPDELISAIVTDLQCVGLKSLSLVSHRLRGIVVPFLFRSLKFDWQAEKDDGQNAPLQLQDLAVSKPLLSQVHEVTLWGGAPWGPSCFGCKPTLAAYSVVSYLLSLPFSNLRRLSFATIPLYGSLLPLLFKLATRRDTELNMIRCQLCHDTSPASAFELRITTLTATGPRMSERPLFPKGSLYHIISASSFHLRCLSLDSQFVDPIDRLLQIKFKALRIFQLYQDPLMPSRIAPLTLSKLLRHLGSLDKLALSPQLTLDPEALLEGASEPPLYDILDVSCQACRILLPDNVVTTLYCRPPDLRCGLDHNRAIIPMIEEGLKQNKKPLHEFMTTVWDQEEARTLTSLASICSESLRSLHIHSRLPVSQRL
jgi:hypothetical protein